MSHVNKKKKKSNLPFIIIFVVGFLILIYPLVSRIYYRVDSNNLVESFDEQASDIDEVEIDERMELAAAYNSTLINAIEDDPYSDDKKERGKAAYADMLKLKELIGHIIVPKISTDLPVYAGTSDDILDRGAGHLEGTSLPIGGNSSHSVITAHAGLPKARLFTDLNKLEVGDRFFYKNIKETLAYEVDQIKVVEPSDFKDLLVEPGHDYMTLLTCTPIMINSHRLLVRGHRVDYDETEERSLTDKGLWDLVIRVAFYLVLIMIVILVILNISYVRKTRTFRRKLEELMADDRKLGDSDED